MDQHTDLPESRKQGSIEARPGVVTGLSRLPREAHIDIRAFAEVLGCSIRSVERAIRRGELPPPFRLLGKRTWLAGVITDHLAERQRRVLQISARRDAARARADGY